MDQLIAPSLTPPPRQAPSLISYNKENASPAYKVLMCCFNGYANIFSIVRFFVLFKYLENEG